MKNILGFILGVLIALLTATVSFSAEGADPAASLFSFLPDWWPLAALVLLGISESLAHIPAVKSNGIFQLVLSILKAVARSKRTGLKCFLILFLLSSVSVPMLTGCAGTIKKIEQNEATLEIAVTLAANAFFDKYPEFCQSTIMITDDAISSFGDESLTTLEGLESFVVSRVKWDRLEPMEQAAIKALLSVVRIAAENYMVDRGVDDPKAATVIAVDVLTWVNHSARMQG